MFTVTILWYLGWKYLHKKGKKTQKPYVCIVFVNKIVRQQTGTMTHLVDEGSEV